MSQLVEALYPVPDLRRTPLSQLMWWERRRLFYNKVVGATGLVTLAGFSLLFSLPPHSSPPPLRFFFVAPALYALAANVCYSFGWLAEMTAVRVWGRRAPDLGPLLFRQGVIFSVGLTLLPILLAAFIWIIRIAATLAGAA